MIAKVRAFQAGTEPLLKGSWTFNLVADLPPSIPGPDTVIKARRSFWTDSTSMPFSAFEWEGRSNLEVF